MRRMVRAVLTAAACWSAMLSFQGTAGAVVPASLSDDQQKVLTQAEAQLSSLRAVQAHFIQSSSNGVTSEGTVTINRPGRMRLEYTPPSPVLVLANGEHLIYIDKSLDQVSYIELKTTPAGILLRDKVSFKDDDVTVTDVRRQAGVAEIDVQMTAEPGNGRLTLIFNEKPFELRQWRMRDAQGVETAVALSNMMSGVLLTPDKFTFVRIPGQPLNPH